MPFDVPSAIGGYSPSGIIGDLYGLGLSAAQGFISSQFQSTQTAPMVINDEETAMEQNIPGTLSVDVQGAVPGGGCCPGRPRLPDFLEYNQGPQCGYTRLTTRTDRCGNTRRVWGMDRKKPRMNPGNMKAARRAGRRISSAIRHLKTLERALPHRTVTRRK